MSEFSIQVENISKMYLIGHSRQRSDTLRDLLMEMVKNPFNRKREQKDGDQLWALKDVSFEVKQGEVLGIIGRNGMGKSTLLKVLSRITEPTQGRAVINGRVGSLLEVGTGFHPELTGRENVYLNGSLLGMRRAEIDRNFDAIVAFAEIEPFLDTPVKRYSSGMYVRLAFAVAAHLEPEILLIDEVLAVGDAAFQKKCLGKMGEVARGGRTVLFVSHNMGTIQYLCPRSLLLERGKIAVIGKTVDVVGSYLSTFSFMMNPEKWTDLSFVPREGKGSARITNVSYSSGNPTIDNRAYSNGPLDLVIKITSDRRRSVSSISITFYDEFGTKLVNADTVSLEQVIELNEGENLIRFHIDELHLTPGTYTFGAWVANPPAEVYDWIKYGTNLVVVDADPLNIGIRADGAVPCKFHVFTD
jgi:lipopolysaccharide transport system ATP-binding protein